MNKKKIALCIASFFSQFSICMVNFAMIYFMREKYSLSSSVIGIASSIYTVTYFISCLAFSPVYPRLKRRTKAFIALFGMAVTNIIILSFSSVGLMYLMLALYGVTMSFLWPNIEDWITEGEEGRQLAKATGGFNFSWSFGAGLSTMVGGFLVEMSPSVPIAVGALIFLLVLAFLLKLDGTRVEVKNGKKEEGSTGRATLLRYFSWCGNFLNYSCYSLLINIFPLYAMDVLGFSESISGTLLLFRGMTTCFSFIFFSRFPFWQFSKVSVLLSQFALSILFFIFSFLSSSLSIALFFIAFGIVFALLYQMSIFHGASGASNREKRMIIHEVLLNIGMVTGSSLGGIIYEHFSFTAILYILSAVALLFFIAETTAVFILSKKGISL